ncbi:methyl-accepting chemotaxis protein [Aestuariirhabdus litorea]|uniref:Methyl-accepting chemotaxis protein n=1 Tax=Aestuariirhabdus litorea TaxID=2528527 RepID=A0A3P3VMM0_9GAMM|nr:methyl-accepting chemotaxis protein [Aestuariirhabdus litorea]RRJ83674.1 methyl-accepting chemotaxis protein [Aestuariirhabdus litorea]RWW96896.1 HAMP domain-containing protein [Endozoicomonadaceae bacterium GTF-13]
MMLSTLLNSLRSRLLLPLIIAVVAVISLQVVITLVLTSGSVDSLVEEVSGRMAAENGSIAGELDASGRQVQQSIAALSQRSREALASTLKQQLGAEQVKVASQLSDSLVAATDSMAQLLAAVAPAAIWDRDTPLLTEYVRVAHRNPNVIFAFYLDADGNPLTRHLERSDPRVKALLERGEGRRSGDKVLNAARGDSSIYLSEAEINPRGAVIGRFIMGVSRETELQAVAGMEASFAEVISESQKQVDEAIQSQSRTTLDALRTSLGGVKARNEEALAVVQRSIDASSSRLMASLTLTMLVMGGLIVLVLLVAMAIRVLSKIQMLTREIHELASGEGDLTRRIAISSNEEIGDMAAEINRFIEKTQGIVQQVNAASDQTATRIDDLYQQSNRMQDAMDRQKQAVDQVSHALDEIVTSIQYETESVQNALHSVDQVRENTNHTVEISTQVRELFTLLVNKVREASEVVNALEGRSNQIGAVLDVIKGIAEQTNLLALNAAIEAARAGESGRGFAVVADEVRSLASKTQQSTADIQSNIESLQSGAKGAVSVIDAACSHAEEGIEAITRADQLQQNVQESVQVLYDMINNIASMAEEQSHVSIDLKGSVETINGESERSLQSVNEVAETGRELAQLSATLKGAVSQFRV